jgi:hypothetical protein
MKEESALEDRWQCNNEASGDSPVTKNGTLRPGFETGPMEKRDAVFFSASGVQEKEGRTAASVRAF